VEKNRLVNIAQIAHAYHFHMMRAVTFHPNQTFRMENELGHCATFGQNKATALTKDEAETHEPLVTIDRTHAH
jgi:hypothetical protein